MLPPAPEASKNDKVNGFVGSVLARHAGCKAWRRPTLPTLKRQYHRRCPVSRPSSGWDRVGHGRYGHQAMGPAFRSSRNRATFWAPIGNPYCVAYLAEIKPTASRADDDGGTLKREMSN